MVEDRILQERTEKIKSFFKEKYNWVTYVLLTIIVFIATYVRTRNLPGLRDITTGGWTLAQDLDPYLFLRWAKEIISNGFLATADNLRYVPIGFKTAGELVFNSYLIAWFHKIAINFGSTSVEQSAAIFPVVMFALTIIAFFLLVRKTFIYSLGKFQAEMIALASSLFLSLIPALLPRTIAGIPEKESSGFLFLFLAFYFFLDAWKSGKIRNQIIFSILAGISTAAMALIWGGFVYIYVVISLSVLLSLIFGQVKKDKIYPYFSWLLSSFIVMNIYSSRYSFSNLITSTTTLIPIAIFGLLLVHVIITETRLRKYFEPYFSKIPEPALTLFVTASLGIIIALIFFGPSYISDKFSDLAQPLITPISDRLGVTVAENRQPFFSEWAGSFGPTLNNIPLFFWIFFFGSIALYSLMMRVLDKKNKTLVTLGYVLFIVALIFSRYSSSSVFNGTNSQSLIFYSLGFLFLVFSLSYPTLSISNIKKYYNQISIAVLALCLLVFLSPSLLNLSFYKIILGIAVIIFICFSIIGISRQSSLKEVDFGLLVLFSLFFLSLISARASVRTIMVLVPAASVAGVYLAFAIYNKLKRINENYKLFAWIALIIVIIGLLYSAMQFYQQSIFISEHNVKVALPGSQISLDLLYYQQWQKSMAWVRNNTSQNAVFAHWWDYGYWVQTIGERATVLDGGNVLPYWDYLMGRYALTGSNNQEALNFLYSHNVTHFLIDSSDIGKYPAFSSIGSDENYDRYSSFNTFSRLDSDTRELKNSILTMYYPGERGSALGLDEDVTYNLNGTQLIFPAGKAGIYAISIEQNSSGIIGVTAIFAYQNKPYEIPLRYAYDTKLIDFGSGLESGIFIVPYATQNSVDKTKALMFLSKKTVKSQLARLYLYNENNQYFKLVSSEDDEIVSELKASKAIDGDFVYFAGTLRGPIRIWQVSYPYGMSVNPEYLQLDYLNPNLAKPK